MSAQLVTRWILVELLAVLAPMDPVPLSGLPAPCCQHDWGREFECCGVYQWVHSVVPDVGTWRDQMLEVQRVFDNFNAPTQEQPAHACQGDTCRH